MSKVVGSIVVFNPKIEIVVHTIKTFLHSAPHAEVYILDNSTEDLISTKIKEIFPAQVHYIKSSENLGYGRGNNQVFREAPDTFEYFCILNPDLEIPEDTIPQLVSYCDKNPKIGLVTGTIQGADKQVHEVHKMMPSFSHYLQNIFFRLIKKNLPEQTLVHERVAVGVPYQLPILSGCFLFFRRSHYQELRGFDDRFFLYFEDYDLTLRSFISGKSIVLPEVKIIHRWARESRRNWKLFFIHLKSGIQFYSKWGFTSKTPNRVNAKVNVL